MPHRRPDLAVLAAADILAPLLRGRTPDERAAVARKIVDAVRDADRHVFIAKLRHAIDELDGDVDPATAGEHPALTHEDLDR